MSTPDIRHQAHELPSRLGENPSEETLKELFCKYGWVWLSKIHNESSNTVRFYNPYYDESGDVAPNEEESSNSKGFIPYYSADRKYEFTYYNQHYAEWKTVTIKDLDNNWLLSFEQPGVAEDIRQVNPHGSSIARFTLTITNNGFKI